MGVHLRASHVTINNLNIKNYHIGIQQNDVSNNYITNNRITYCNLGISFSDSPNNILESNKLENNIQHLIQDYLLDEGLLRGKISDPKVEFGFQFVFPPGKDPLGRPIGRNMVIIQPKKKNIIIVSLGVQLSEPHIRALDSLENPKKLNFFMDLRKSFLLKDVFYRIDIKNHRYEIIDQIFLIDLKVMEKPFVYTGGGSEKSLVKISTKDIKKLNSGEIVRISQ